MTSQDVQYSEEEIDPGDDARQDMLEHLAGAKPWVFVVADHAGDGIGLEVNCGGGITDATVLRRLLTMAADALPAGE